MWPWDWISAAGNAISGLTQKAVDWVNSLIASVMSWVTDAINSTWKSLQSLWNDVTNVWNQLVGFINKLSNEAWTWINNVANDIYKWAGQMLNDLWSYAKSVYYWALGEINKLYGLVDGWINAIYRWVQKEIWDPLVRLYNDIKNWAVQAFNKVWQYIEHPELLVQLIGAFLLRMWTQYVVRFGSVIARWLIHNMTNMAGEVFDMLETIISSVL